MHTQALSSSVLASDRLFKLCANIGLMLTETISAVSTLNHLKLRCVLGHTSEMQLRQVPLGTAAAQSSHVCCKLQYAGKSQQASCRIKT